MLFIFKEFCKWKNILCLIHKIQYFCIHPGLYILLILINNKIKYFIITIYIYNIIYRKNTEYVIMQNVLGNHSNHKINCI